MSDEGQSIHEERREFYFSGKSPQEFIGSFVTQVEQTSKAHDPDYQFGVKDIAGSLAVLIREGVVIMEEVESCVAGMNLDEYASLHFMDQFIPEAMEDLDREDQEFANEDAKKQRESAKIFTEVWGVERIGELTKYYGKKLEASDSDPEWKSRVQRFEGYKPQLEETVASLEDPEEKALSLMRNIYYITNLYPSEAAGIFDTEQRTNSHVYLDGLFKASVALNDQKVSHDPDLDSTKFNFGVGNVSVNLYRADDPDSMKRRKRREILDGLPYGASTSLEETGSDKSVVFPNSQEPQGIDPLLPA